MLPNFKIGVGTWAWGDYLIWDYGFGYDEQSLYEVFLRSLRDGINFFSTSETFSDGRSERLLGSFIEKNPNRVFISTKYAPQIWRFRRKDFLKSLHSSLEHLKIPAIDLYQVLPPAGLMKLPVLADCISEAYESGLIRNVGVSNFSAAQIEQFYELLNRLGIPLSSLETEYSLLNRDIETNGVLEICSRLQIRIIAQSPLAMGILTGKYTSQNEPEGIRRKFMEKYESQNLPLLFRLLNNIGSEHEGRNSAQVSLNWLIQKKVIPIPGAKTVDQVMQNNQAIGWDLTEEQVEQLDDISAGLLKYKG